MRHIIPCLLIVAACLTACLPLGVASKPTARPSAKAKPPVPTASGVLTPASAAPSRGPAEPMVLLKGTLMVDAHYAVSAGGANVVSAGGANVVSAGGGNVVSAGGANVVSAGGANVVSAGGANFRLAAAPGVPIGTMLPAKGMGVVPVSLLTGEPVGEVVFTGDRGQYEVAVPERLKGQVLLYASMPGRSATDAVLRDPRLHYPFLPSIVSGDRQGAITEDTALGTTNARMAFVAILETLMAKATPDYKMGPEFAAWLGNGASAGGSGALLMSLMQGLVREMSAIDSAAMTPEARLKLASKLGDLMAIEVDWKAAMVDQKQAGWQGEGEETAMGAFLDLMKQGREAAAAKMIAEPDFFARQPWLVEANQGRPVDKAFVIRKPSDLNDFLLHAYIGPNELDAHEKVRVVYAAIGVPPRQADRLKAAQYGMLTQIGLTLFTKPTLKADMVAMIRSKGVAPVASSSPAR